MIYKGIGGSLELLDDRLIIRRTTVFGFLSHGFKGEKTIPYSAITAVQFKRAALGFRGYIQFTMPGSNESRKGLYKAVTDENTLLFTNNEEFEKAREFVESKMGRKADVQAHSPSTADTLEKFANLFERGLLTKQEFEQQKSSLLKTSNADPMKLSSPQSKAPSEDNDDEKDDAADPAKARMLRAIERAAEQRNSQSPTIQSNSSTFGRRGRR